MAGLAELIQEFRSVLDRFAVDAPAHSVTAVSYSLKSSKPLNEQLPFDARSVVIDNRTSSYLKVVGAGRWVDPGLGASMAINANDHAQIEWTAPPGKAQIGPVAGEEAQIVFYRDAVPPGSGVSSSQPVNLPSFPSIQVTGLSDLQGGVQVTGPARFKGTNPWVDVSHPAFGQPTGNDWTAPIAAADAFCNQAGGDLMFPPGTYGTGSQQVTGQSVWFGAGRGLTTLQANVGAAGPLLNVSPAATVPFQLRDISFDMANAPGIDVILINNIQEGLVRNVRVVNGGAIGLHLTNCTNSYFEYVSVENTTTAAILINGDNSAELYFTVIDIQRSVAGVLADGFRVDRTVAGQDNGAYYLYGVRITRTAGTVTNGFNFNKIGAGNDFNPIFMEQCVADNINGNVACLFTRHQGAHLRGNNWFTCTAGNLNPTMRFDGGQDFEISAWFQPDPAAACCDFVNAPANLIFDICRFNTGTAFNLPALNPPTGIVLGTNMMTGAAWANDLGRLSTACSSQILRAALQVLTNGAGGRPQTLDIWDGANNTHKSIRVNNLNLEILNSAFTAVIATLADSGDLGLAGGVGPSTPALAAQAGRLYMGVGAPNNANGNNGDGYFRTDTPATANQRFYVKSAGAWVGIL